MDRKAGTRAFGLLLVLVLGAITAQDAAASVKGTTAYTCKPEAGTHQFADAHCKLQTESGSFSHVAISEGSTTSVEFSNITTGTERSTALLESSQAGIAMQIAAKKVVGTGTMTNKKAASGEHYVEGAGIVVFEEVTVTKPAGKGCSVTGGLVVTKQLYATTREQGDLLKVTPSAGSLLAEFTVAGCSTAALNGVHKVEGSLKAKLSGPTATTTHSEVTGQGTLFQREKVAGFEGTVTISGRSGSSGGFTPLAATTGET